MNIPRPFQVLIIEDEPDVASTLGMLLKSKFSASVKIAGDCASAREEIGTTAFDLITMDYQLPDGDGLCLLEEIVTEEDAPPVVMVTGHGDEKTAVSAFKLGASGYVVKDARMSTMLVEEVRSALARAGQARAEAELRRSEERYRNVFENTRNGIAVYEAVRDGEDFVFRDFNKAAKAIEGVSREDVVGKSVLEAFPGVREFGLFDVFQRVWKTGVPEHHPLSRYADKRITGWRDSYVYCLSSGEVVAVYTDVTEQKQAEEALRESEAHLKAISDGAMDTIVLIDSNLTICHWNPTAEKLFGFTEEEALDRSLAIIFPEAKHQAYTSALEEFIHTGQRTFTFDRPSEMTFIRKDGAEFIAEVSASRLQIGEEWHAEFIARDITERKKAEKALSRTQFTVDNSADSVFWLSPEAEIIYANEEACRRRGYTKEEILSLTMFDINVDFVADPGIWEMMRARLRESGHFTSEFRHRTKGGEVFPVEVSLNRFFFEGDELFAANISDITDRKRVEERRKLATELLLLLNRSEKGTDAIKEILGRVKEFSGFEAVGIRLKKGDDYPYYETSGFPESFVELERNLCAYEEGEVVRDAQGNVVLECMCGNVIQGRTDPALPFFTVGGSFWSNNTSELLASTTEEDRQARTRNRCNGEGYESVALIPLKSGDETIGLLQFNDKRTDMFTLDLIEFFEEVGASIGVVLARMEAESALAEAEKKYRALAEALPQVVFEIDMTGRILYLNNNAYELFGYGREEIDENFNALNVFDESDRERVVGAIGKMVDGRSDGAVREYRGRRKDGTVFPVRAYTSLLTNDIGERVGIGGILIDITEERTHETYLRVVKEQWERTFKSVSECMFLINRDHTIVQANEACSNLLGIPAKDILGSKCYDLIHGSDSPPDYCVTCSSRETLDPVDEEIYEPTLEKYLHVTANPITDSEGNLEFIVHTLSDITERKNTEERVQEGLSFRQVILDTIPNPVFYKDVSGVYTGCNEAFCEYLGFPKEEIIGNTVYEISPKEQADVYYAKDKELFENPGVQIYEAEVIYADGTLHDVVFNTATYMKNGAVEGMVGVILDVTERKEYEERLKRINTELEGYTHTVSHDLRGPIAAMSLSWDLMHDILQHSVSEEERESLLEITGMGRSSISRMAGMTDDLLLMAEAGAPTDVYPVNVTERVNEILLEKKPDIEAKNLKVLTDPDLGTVVANPTHIYQVFSNLIKNAVRYIESEEPVLEIRLLSTGNGVNRYLVRDNGVGIPEDLLPDVFAPFAKGAGGDTGIGLSIVEKIVRTYGGNIRAYNDNGACFEFPLRDYDEAGS